VSCQTIEEQLLEFDGLLEAAVIGIADEVLGEAIKAFVVPRDPRIPGFEEQLRQFCRQNIPLKWNPKAFVVLSALPKNNAGKVLKQALREK
jgi:acyl-CoA synthetase (AMP-forming)/AMP-acid ligase II